MKNSQYCKLALLFCFFSAVSLGQEQQGQLFGVSDSTQLQDSDGNWAMHVGLPNNPIPIREGFEESYIGIIDSGIDLDHPQLEGLVKEYIDFTGEGIQDFIGHGTIVAIRTQIPGNAPPPELNIEPTSLPIKVAKVAHINGTLSKQDVIKALIWMAEEKVVAVNMSLGFYEGTGDYSDLCQVAGSLPNMFISAASGNEGDELPAYPAACNLPNVVSVCACDRNGQCSSYSGPGEICMPDETRLEYRQVD